VPIKNRLNFTFTDPLFEVYYLKILDQLGRTLYMLPKPQLQNGIDVSQFESGVYFLQLIDNKTKKTVTKKFIKQ
jgi:hypothetical protein